MKFIVKLAACLITTMGVSICLLGCTTTKENAKFVTLPGTGITLKQPPGMELGPAGSILLDEAGTTVITFAVSDASKSLEDDPSWQTAFAHDPEKISTRGISGNLYHRTRAVDGGAWDGWFFAIPRANKILTVIAMYTGEQPEGFAQLPKYLTTITWDEQLLDPELALGLSVNAKGFQLQKDVIGSLLYRAADTSELVVQAMPVSKVQSTLDKFKMFCSSMGKVLDGKPFSGPYFIERQGIQTCEIWNRTDQPEMHYVALVRLPSGALFNVMGISTKARFKSNLPVFRAAIKNVKPLARVELLPPGNK